MASPIKPSDWCATVVDASATLCSKIESFFQVPELLCDFFTWMFTEAGEFQPAFEAMMQASVGVPTGSIIAFSTANVPEGYLECNGQAVGRTDYPALFALIGTTYGEGNQLTTFNVPDCRDRAIVGRSGTKPMGTTGGASTVLLTENNIPTHSHGLPDGTMTYTGASAQKGTSSGNAFFYTEATSTDDAGGGQSFSIQNPYFAGVWMIKT